MPRPALAQPPTLISTTEADRIFRMRKGTAAAACRVGKVKCAVRNRAGHETYLIDLKDANRVWGCA